MPETNILAVVVIIVTILSLLFTFALCSLPREFLLQPLQQQHAGKVENLKSCGEVVIFFFVLVALSFCSGLLGSQVSARAQGEVSNRS